MPRRIVPSSCICFPHPLFHFKKPSPPGNAIGFQGRCNRQAYGFVRPAFVCHHQVGIHGVQPPLPAFHRSIEAFQVNGNIGSLLHASVSSFITDWLSLFQEVTPVFQRSQIIAQFIQMGNFQGYKVDICMHGPCNLLS